MKHLKFSGIIQYRLEVLINKRKRRNNHFMGFTMPKDYREKVKGWLVGSFVRSFYGVSTLFGSFNAESSHFDKRLKQFSLVEE